MSVERKYDLEDRLIRFGAAVIRYVDRLPNTIAGRHLGGQLIRSGTAPALHYGEAQSAESSKDFIHKIKIALKELRESRANLRMIGDAGMMAPTDPDHIWLLNESLELIRILSKSAKTASNNLQRT